MPPKNYSFFNRKNKPELKPCPFCNGEAEITKTYLYGEVTGYVPHCTKCGCELSIYKSKQGAENAWNRRVDNER